MGVLVLVLSNTKVVHRLDCSSARIFASTNLNPPPHAPALRVVVVVVFVVVVVVVLHARCLCSACTSQRFAMALKALMPTNHHVHPTTAYTCLHQPSPTPSHRLHQPPFTQTTLYTKPRFTPTAAYTTPPFTPTTVYTLSISVSFFTSC